MPLFSRQSNSTRSINSHDSASKVHLSDTQLVAELGRRALTQRDTGVILDDAMSLVSDRFGTEYVKILELVPGGNGFLLTAGIGWQPGYVGQVVVPLTPESQAGYTMQVNHAVVVDDLKKERRFRGMPLLHEHGVISGISTVLRGRDYPHGIMSAHSREKRKFSSEDVAFFDSVAAVVAAVMDRRDTEEELDISNQRLVLAMEAGRLGTWEWNPQTGKVVWSEEVERTYGLAPGEFAGTVDAYLAAIHPDDQEFVSQQISRALDDGRLEMEYRIKRPDGEVRWLTSRGLVIPDARGQPARMLGVCFDETERKLEEKRIRAQYAVTKAMAEADSLEDAISGVLAAICRELDWAIGQMWLLDKDTGELRFADRCEQPGFEGTSFAVVSGGTAFKLGEGLPGRVLESRQPAWIADLAADRNFPRFPAAAESGLRSGFAFPMLLNRDVLGVMEFFSTGRREEGGDFLQAIAAIGSQIGQYIERKRAEDERRKLLLQLQAAETRYQTLFEEVGDAILIADGSGQYIDANSAASDLLGYSRAELLQMNVGNVVAAGEEWGAKQFAEFIHAGEWSGELELRRKDGGIVAADAHATTINVPGEDVHVSVIRDITQRRSEEASRAFLSQASAILSSSLDYGQTLASLAQLCVPFLGDWCAIDMVDGDELRRVSVVHTDPAKVKWAEQLRDRYPPDHRDPVLAQLIKNRRSILIAEITEELIRSQAQDAEMAEVVINLGLRSAMAVPIEARGRTLGVLTLATAETSRSYSETDLALAEDLGRRAGLAVDNARLYSESQSTQEELRLANESKDEFLGLISHELRTPMTTIRGGARLLRRRGDELDAESRNDLLADIEHEAERLQRIVEDLLVLARVELGEDFATEPVLLQRVVEHTVDSYKKRHAERQIEIQAGADVPPANASEIYLEQVLLNLINNADKYSPKDQPIEVRTERREHDVVTSVLDRGPGIPAEEMERIFDRFYRSAGTAKRVRGAGMGLTVCKRLIEAQGGSIWAEAREGSGLIVSFSLPAYDDLMP